MARDHDRASGPVAPPSEPGAPPPAAGVLGVETARPLGADPLSDVLEVVRLTGALFFLVDASMPWCAEAPDSETLAPTILPRVQHVVSYHVITAGRCWCHMTGQPPLQLESGDVLVVPHGDAYALSSPAAVTLGVSLDQTLTWFRQMASGELPFVTPGAIDNAPERPSSQRGERSRTFRTREP